MKNKKRVGILGGTFNPVHLGHLISAQTAFEAFDLARVLFVPCATPAHKDASSLISAQHRRAMLAAAIEGGLRFEISDVELRRGDVSYSVETVAQLRAEHPDWTLLFIVGSDTLPELHYWKDVDRLLELCEFGVIQRPGFGPANMTADQLKLAAPWPEQLLANVVKGPLVDISSSDVRHRIAEGMSVRYLVPDDVDMYISEHGLYGGAR